MGKIFPNLTLIHLGIAFMDYFPIQFDQFVLRNLLFKDNKRVCGMTRQRICSTNFILDSFHYRQLYHRSNVSKLHWLVPFQEGPILNSGNLGTDL
jgi:hypothetical protein